MRGVENIEKVFELVFAGLAVVKRERKEGKQGPDARRHRAFQIAGKHTGARCRTEEFAKSRAAAQIDQHGEEDAAQAIVHLDKAGKRDHARKCGGKAECADRDACALDRGFFENLFYCLGNGIFLALAGKQQRVQEKEQHDRERKGDQNAEIQLVGHEKVDHLADRTQPEDAQKVFETVARMAKALGNAKRVKRERDPADDAQPRCSGEENHARVVGKHADRRDDLDPKN